MNRAVFASLTIMCLLSISSIMGLIQLVKADGGKITINADGSITPSTAPIQRNGDTYTLTGNINITSDADGIDIERDNIVLDGAGYTVTGSESGNGMDLINRNNVTIKNTNIENFDVGPYLENSSNNTIGGNNVTANNYEGIGLVSSSNNSISGNDVTASNYSGIGLDSSSNNSVSGNNVTANNGNSIYLYYSVNNSVSGNNVASNGEGIMLYYSFNNSVSGNNVTANKSGGIVFGYSSNNTLSGNNVANNYVGIGLESTSGNTLSSNNVTANTNYSILLNSSSNNAFDGNNITNSEYGIEFSVSSNNLIFQNNFVNNTNQANTEFSANTWDDGKWGNYWSDYLTKYPNATEADDSGVWNTPYVIDTNNTDNNPLMVQYVYPLPEFPSFLILPLFFIATLLTVIIYKKKGVKTSQS